MVGLGVFVVDAPFVARGRKGPGGEGDGAGREGDGHGDCFLVPGGVGGHQFGVGGDVGGGHVGGFVAGDGVDEAEGFELGELRVLGGAGGAAGRRGCCRLGGS